MSRWEDGRFMKRSGNVGEFISAAPGTVRPRLRAVRAAIRSSAPRATESISYGMPFYSYKGEAGVEGRLCYFDFWDSVVRFYMRPGDLEPHAKLIARYRTTKSALRFPAGEPIPVVLIEHLVRDAVRRHGEAESGSVDGRGSSQPHRGLRKGRRTMQASKPNVLGDALPEVAAEVERTIRSVAPRAERVVKFGAPTFQGQGDIITIGVWTQFVAVGFWNGAKLAARHPMLEGTAASSRVARLRTVRAARSPAFKLLVREAVELEASDPEHPGAAGPRRTEGGISRRRGTARHSV